MGDLEDPRVYFAAERTLLAWVRTGLTVIGLGFVVARFGLFLRLIGNQTPNADHTGSQVIGVGLVLLGSVAMGVAAWQHVQFCRGLGPSSRPRPYILRWPVWFAVLLLIIGIALAGYILWETNAVTNHGIELASQL